jgi:hypothetical protein
MPKNVYFLLCKTIKLLLRLISKVKLSFHEMYECSEMFAVDSYILLRFATPCVSNEATIEAIPFMIVMKDE